MGKALLLAFERGYNAIPGIIAQDMMSWSDMKAVMRELKKEEVRNSFQSIIVDTVDIAGTLCEKFVCNQNGVDRIGAIPYGQGWTMMKNEFESTFRAITQLGYAVFFISHDKDKVFKTKEGVEYNQIVPSCPTSFNEIAKNMADVYAYAEKYVEDGIAKVRLILRSLDNRVDTGSRFKYIVPQCDMSYQALTKAINDAIDKEAAMTDGQYVTDEREPVHIDTVEALDYESLITEFNNIVASVMEKDPSQQPKIIYIVEKYLGQGKKVSESTYAQVELIKLINDELKDMYSLT